MSDSEPVAAPDKLVSAVLFDDPDMYDLVEEFVDGLDHRLSEFRRAYEQLSWEKLATLAHQLRGAGGSHGYPDIGALGATMEAAFRAHSAEQFGAWMTRFERLIAAARAGLQDG